MPATTEVRVPDIGDFKDVPIIEVMVKRGDKVQPDDALITLESDKATMDVPAPLGGKVEEVKVRVGDKVSEGSILLILATGTSTGDLVVAEVSGAAPRAAPIAASANQAPPVASSAAATDGGS